MIESRAQRRQTTLLHRRKVAIIVFLAIFVVLATTLILLNHYFNTVFEFLDYDETIYYVKKVNGTFGMYDKDDKLLTTSTPPGTTEKLYITKIGTWVDVDPDTGKTKIRGIPDVHVEDGESLDAADFIVIFPSIETDSVKSVEVKNPHGSYSIKAVKKDGGGRYFVLGEAPFIATDENAISYITYYAAHATANMRLDKALKDLSEYGLVAETRVDENGELYEYTPSYYVVTTDSGEKHKLIIGDKLVNGSGYYVQYENSKGEVRPSVYILTPADVSSVNEKMTYDNTIMGPAKNYLIPSLVYAPSSNTYYEVEDFSVSKKEGTEYDELINFSYIDLDDRTGTVLGIHPYVFNKTSFSSYNPNHDNIDGMLQMLIDPQIVDIAAINPSDADKAKYGLMKLVVDADGNPVLDKNGKEQYTYDAEYVLKFDRYITQSYTDDKGQAKEEKFKITQRVYISKMNENGNYYTYTLITMPEATDKGMIESININVINEVSEETLVFLKWDPYNWVYPSFMQIRINHVKSIEMTYGNYTAKFILNHGKEGDMTTLGVDATGSDGKEVNTFSLLTFIDREGYRWVVSPQRIFVYDKDGNDVGGATSRHYEYNSIGEQVHVIDSFRTDENGNKIYIQKDKVIIVHTNGKTEEILRYHTTIFKKTFSNLITMRIVDSYVVPEEEIAEIVKDENHIITIKITDEEGTEKVCEFYSITARKAYVVVDGQGGFYVHTAKLTKLINDIGRFFNGEDVDMEAIV